MNKNKVFIERTLGVLRQYDSSKQTYDISYAHTLFINCCVGLLIVPKEEVYEILSKEESIADWGIDITHIEICRGKMSVGQIVRHMRNSIAHNKFDFAVESISTPINQVIFEDGTDSDKPTFRAVLNFNEFEEFVKRVALFANESLSDE